MNKNILKYKSQIEQQIKLRRLEYTGQLDFNYGYISALLSNDLINIKESNILKKVYASASNSYLDWAIDKNGELFIYE